MHTLTHAAQRSELLVISGHEVVGEGRAGRLHVTGDGGEGVQDDVTGRKEGRRGRGDGRGRRES